MPLSGRTVQPNGELDVQLQAASHVSVGSQLLELLGFGRSWPEFSRSIRKLTVGSLFRKLSRQHKLCASVHSLAPRQLHVLVPDPVLALKLRPSQVVSTTLRNVEGETTPRLQEAFQVRCWHAGLGGRLQTAAVFVGNLGLSLFHLALGALSAFGGCYQQHIFWGSLHNGPLRNCSDRELLSFSARGERQ